VQHLLHLIAISQLVLENERDIIAELNPAILLVAMTFARNCGRSRA